MRRFLGRLTALVMLAAASLAVLGVIGLAEALAQQHQSISTHRRDREWQRRVK